MARCSANCMASAVLPAAVGPTSARMGLSAGWDVLAEPGQHAGPGIRRRGFIVARAGVVEKRVIGARVDLEVVRYASGRQCALNCLGAAANASVELAIEAERGGFGV